MLEAIFTTLTEISGYVITWFTSLFTSVGEVFFVPGAEGGLTLLGTLSLISVAVGAFYFVLRWVLGLIRVRTRG